MKKQDEMLKLWRKFIIGMRIKERLDEYGPIEDAEEFQDELDKQFEIDLAAEDQGGGFLLEDAIMCMNENDRPARDPPRHSNITINTSLKGKQRSEQIVDDGYGGGFLAEDQAEDTGNISDNGGGGFIVDDEDEAERPDDYGGGRFIPEDESEEPTAASHTLDLQMDNFVDDALFADEGYSRKRRRRMISADLEDDDDEHVDNDDDIKSDCDEYTMLHAHTDTSKGKGKGKGREGLLRGSKASNQIEDVDAKRLREIEDEVQRFLQAKAEAGDIVFTDQMKDSDKQIEEDGSEEDYMVENDEDEEGVVDEQMDRDESEANSTSNLLAKHSKNEGIPITQASPMSIDPIDGEDDAITDDKGDLKEKSSEMSVNQGEQAKGLEGHDELGDDGGHRSGLDELEDAGDEVQEDGEDDVKDEDFEYEDDAGWYSP